MGSKKNKKLKQEGTQEPLEIEDLLKSPKFHKRKRQSENEVINIQDDVDVKPPSHKRKKNAENEVADIQDEQDLETLVKPKKKKKKNKLTDTSTKAPSEEIIVTNGLIKDEQMKVEVVEIDIEHLNEDNQVFAENPDFPQEIDDRALHKEVTMPQDDLLELIRKIAVLLPENDCLSYKCRADKIQWDDVAFSNYSAEECKKTWFLLQKRIRRYRILKEVLDDAKSFVINPPKTKKKIYPGMPQKPPTSYQLFYKKKKPLLLSNEPGLDIAEISKRISQMFKNLSPEKKTKYEKQAAQLKAKYEEELQVFYANHPEIAESMKKEKLSENKPSKPSNPFMLYFKSQLRKNGNSESKDINDNVFKEQCKDQWKQLSMKKKMLWITKAEQDVARYEEQMKEYVTKHPNYNHIPVKSILNKEEMALKERYLGKPDKPPTSAYSLFSKNLLQSDEIKKFNAKDRMNHIATLWKNCTEEEKNKFKSKVEELMEQYKKDYEKYLESLPEDKKQLELQKNIPKKKNKSESANKNKKAKGKLEKLPEPATPPISAFSYFATSKNIDDRKIAKKEWKKLSDEEKKGYEKKLVEIKREYILQFEKFLNSLSKEELEEFSKTKQELKFNSEDFADDDEDDDSTSSSEDDSDVE